MALNEGIHRNERDPITSCGIIRWRTNSRPCIRSMMDVWISSEQGTSGEDGPESESHLRVRFHKISDSDDFEQSLKCISRSFSQEIVRFFGPTSGSSIEEEFKITSFQCNFTAIE